MRTQRNHACRLNGTLHTEEGRLKAAVLVCQGGARRVIPRVLVPRGHQKVLPDHYLSGRAKQVCENSTRWSRQVPKTGKPRPFNLSSGEQPTGINSNTFTGISHRWTGCLIIKGYYLNLHLLDILPPTLLIPFPASVPLPRLQDPNPYIH